jgi:hypothetical protein
LTEIRYAVRALCRNAGFTATTVAALSLGVAANTAIFSVVNKVLLELLPYPQPDRLVELMSKSPLGDEMVVSIPRAIGNSACIGGLLPSVWGRRDRRADLLERRRATRCTARGRHQPQTVAQPVQANPMLVGSAVSLDHERCKVIGVLADGFSP